MPSYNSPAYQCKPGEDAEPQRTEFAHQMAQDAFGVHCPHPDAATFRDRNPPEIVAPATRMQFHRGRHRRLASWRFAG